MRSPLWTSSFHSNGKYEKASTLVLSGPRKKVEYGGDVRITMKKRQDTSRCPRGRGGQTWSQPCTWSQVKSVVCFWHHFFDVSNVRLMHEEASCQHNPKVRHPLQVQRGRTLRAAFRDRVSLRSLCPDERKLS